MSNPLCPKTERERDEARAELEQEREKLDQAFQIALRQNELRLEAEARAEALAEALREWVAWAELVAISEESSAFEDRVERSRDALRKWEA